MTNPPAPLTLARLIELDACERGLDLFESTFGDSVDMANPPDGYETLDFYWGWAACKLLDRFTRLNYDKITKPAWAHFYETIAPARTDCIKISAAAWAKYRKITAPARAERDKTNTAAAQANYDIIIAPARAERKKTLAAARAERNKSTAAAQANYNRTLATAFVTCYMASPATRANFDKTIAATFYGQHGDK